MCRFQFVEDHARAYGARRLCRILGVRAAGSTGGGLLHLRVRRGSRQSTAERIRAVHTACDGTYGIPRITAEQGWLVNHKRVPRLMREAGLSGPRLRWRVRTAVPEPSAAAVPDLLERDFAAHVPNARYVGDIIYLPMSGGRFLYVGRPPPWAGRSGTRSSGVWGRSRIQLSRVRHGHQFGDRDLAGPVPSWRFVSSTGYWVLGALEQDALDALLADVGSSVFEPLPSDLDLGWWRVMDKFDVAEPARLGYGACCPTDAAVRFQQELLGLRPDPDVLDACIAAIGEAAEADSFVVAVRKGDPVAALYYGLGFDVARRLPGRAGCFLLHARAQEDLAGLTGILDTSTHERARFVDRVSRWLEVMGDQPDLDPLILLDGPLRLARRARETHSGLLAVLQWY